MFDLNDKIAIVTGGLGILGRKFCKGLAEHGAITVVVDLDAREVEAFARELGSQFGVKTMGVSCDVSEPDSVKNMVVKVITEFGRIDILHNNAAWKSKDLKKFFLPTEEYQLSTWREIMSVNLDGMFLVAQSVGRQMIAQNTGGSIIQTASIYGLFGPDKRIYAGSQYLGGSINTPAVYSVSKGAVIALTKHLACEWAEHGIRVNALVPGGVESGQNDVFVEKYANRVPLNRMAKAEEMVGALIYLASDASSYMTGQSLVVDGGLSAW